LHATNVKHGKELLIRPRQLQIQQSNAIFISNIEIPTPHLGESQEAHENEAAAVIFTAFWVNLAAVFESEKSNIQWQK
jgi:hypothetical protein